MLVGSMLLLFALTLIYRDNGALDVLPGDPDSRNSAPRAVGVQNLPARRGSMSVPRTAPSRSTFGSSNKFMRSARHEATTPTRRKPGSRPPCGHWLDQARKVLWHPGASARLV